MTILLAPMEGLLDFVLRDILTRAGGVDRCVSEFIRITDQLLPERVFTRIVPELHNGGRTLAGVPERAQLLGSDPACMADNAARLAALGPAGIDLNFGCPANVVNRHGGGAALLKEPATIAAIVAAVRRAVPASMPVSAKMRLGYHDDALAVECAQAIAGSGAGELVVHARTKAQAYRPPAYWERIADIRAAVAIPVVANGEIWTVDDWRRCREICGPRDIMIGRGLVARPDLARQIAAAQAGEDVIPMTWAELQPMLRVFWQHCVKKMTLIQAPGRLKQWLALLTKSYPEATTLFDALRRETDCQRIGLMLGVTADERS